MKMKKFLIAALACLSGFTNAAVAVPQCSSSKGDWSDNYGYQWHLMDANGNGNVYIWYCQSRLWSVNGYTTSGQLAWFASNPNWEDDVCYNFYFYYEGSIATGGCNTAAGTWTNDYGQTGTWNAGKICEIPSYETTYLGNWGGGSDGTWYVFNAVVQNTAAGNLSGRKYRETNAAPGNDQCYDGTGNIPRFDSVTQPNPFYLSSNNAYIDQIGWSQRAIDYYRSQGLAPCHTTIYQAMQIACGPDGIETYTTVQNNTLVAEIGVTTLTSTRGGVTSPPLTH